MNIDLLKRPFIVLLTVPAFIAIGIGFLPLVTVYVEASFLEGKFNPAVLFFGAESARTALTVVAGGAMTALSLTYSLVLVVFTLAAGNIGPRLLKRFTSDLVNQVTAGIFGGTFLYAMITLLFVEADFVPKITIFGAGLLAILTVMQLIYFVRHVSKSVTIDDEIAEITTRLKDALESEYDRTSKDDNELEDKEFSFEITTEKAGYIGSVNEDKLVKIASENNLAAKLMTPLGGFILEGEPVLCLTKEIDDELHEKVHSCVRIETARSVESAIEFSTNLLVEIGLRALSPGVNDTFTALAAVDSFSNAFSQIAKGQVYPSLRRDENENVRLVMPSLSADKLVDQAFNPLRRASAQNILMAEGLARAYARLWVIGNDEMKKQVEKHTSLLFMELESANHFKEDLDAVASKLPRGLRKHFKK